MNQASLLEARTPFGCAVLHQVQGLKAGVRGQDVPSLLADVIEPFEGAREPAAEESLAFLRRMRGVAAEGKLNGGAKACAAAFKNGFLETFPDSESFGFVRILSRSWGIRLSPLGSDPSSAADEKHLRYSKDAGTTAGEYLRFHYEMGRCGGLPETVLQRHLHLRYVPEFLALSGWLLGCSEFLLSQEDDDAKTHGRLTYQFRKDIIRHAFCVGADYALSAFESIPRMLGALSDTMDACREGDPELADLLIHGHAGMIGFALRSGMLNYVEETLEDLPAKIASLHGLMDDAVVQWTACNPKRTEQLTGREKELNEGKRKVIGSALEGGFLGRTNVALIRWRKEIEFVSRIPV